MTPGRIAVVAIAAVFIPGLWFIASEPWGLSIWEMLPFTAPAALLGIGAGWMSHAMKPDRWTWKAGRNAAIVGALVLPPIMTVALALVGARPERVLTSTVRAAWLALLVGLVWAIATWLMHRFENR
jgi:hypothetical protein